MRPKLSYANVMSTLCFFLLLGGGAAYAASHLGKNSVGAKQLKKNAVTTAKVKNEAITAAKVKKGTLTGAQINVSTLGKVPTADNATTAGTASVAKSLPAPEPWHVVGAPGEPAFFEGWENEGSAQLPTAGFYKDQLGIVHLRGAVKGDPGSHESMFQLPPGFRPGQEKDWPFSGYCSGGAFCVSPSTERIDVVGGNFPIPELSGNVTAFPANLLSLNGIAFRAES